MTDTKKVKVPGVGVVAFPVDMPDEKIVEVIKSGNLSIQMSEIISPQPGATQEFVDANMPPPETTSAGMYGAATRSAAPYAAAALAGGVVGGPGGATAGVTSMMLGKLIGDPLISGVNNKFGTSFATPTEAFNKFFDYLGVDRPDTATEEFVGLIAEGMASGPMAKGRSVIGQIGSGGMAAAAGEGARMGAEQAGLGEGWQLGVSLLASTSTGIATMPGLRIDTNPMTAESAAKITRRAAKGDPSAKATLAYHAQDGIDPATKRAAENLGVAEYLTPGQLTTNKVVRELEEALSEFPDSSLGKARTLGVKKAVDAIDNTVQSLSKSDDVFDFSLATQRTRDALKKQIDDLDLTGRKAYDELSATIDPKYRVNASETLAYLNKRIDNLGGGKEGLSGLSEMERSVYNSLKPRARLIAGEVKDEGPTYTMFDKARRDVGNATRGKTDFKNQDTGEAKKLYDVMSSDHERAVMEAGGDIALLRAGKAAVTQRKAVEDSMIMLFGKELDRSLSSTLRSATKGLSSGDAERWNKIMNAIPTEIRPRVAAGAVATVLNKHARDGDLDIKGFVKWYAGVQANSASRKALLGSLTPEARTGLDNIYRVGKIITDTADSNNKRYLQSAIAGSTGLMHNITSAAKRAATVVGFQDFIGGRFHSQAGSYSFANATTAALSASKQAKSITAANRLFGSPEFRSLVRAMSDGSSLEKHVNRLAKSQMMLTFMRQANLSTRNEDIKQFIYNGIMPREQESQ
jgi:hypothetical protein